MVANHCLFLALTAATLFGESAAPLSLQEVVRRAVAKAQADNARTALAESQLRLLEAQSKWKLELRPSLGLFSFSNPGLLAANIGSSLMLQRWSAPSPVAMQSAKVDVLAAEVAGEHSRVDAQVRAGHAFFDLLERQQVVAMLDSALKHRRSEHSQVVRLVNAGKVTALDVIAVEMQVLDLEQQRADAETQRRSFAIELSNLIGAPELADVVTVADEPEHVRFDSGLPASEVLLQQAFTVRPELTVLRNRLAELESRLRPHAPVRIESATGGYAYLTQATGLLGSGLKGSLMGGNTGNGVLNVAIPLRKTGEKEAADAVLAARIQLVKDELRNVEEQLRVELMNTRSRAVTATVRREIAKRRVELLERQARMISARVEGGLASRQDLFRCEQESLRAQAELTQANGVEIASHYALRVVSGSPASHSADNAPARAGGGGEY